MPWLRLAIASFFLTSLSATATAQDWPSRPVRVLVPFTAGSGTDLVARAVAEQLSTQLGQPIIVENRGGAGGTLGVAAAAKAEPDGYTLLVTSTAHAANASTHARLPYNPRTDLVGVAGFATLPNVLVVPANKGYDSVRHLVDAARAGQLNYASGGSGSGAHLAAERFLLAAGVTAQHIPFRGGPEALNEMVSGRIDFYFVPLPPARGLMSAGKIRAIAVSGSQRASVLPDVPTTIEAGYADTDYNFWVGLFAPSGVPKAVIERLSAETLKALDTPGLKTKLAGLGVDPLPMTAADFEQFVQKEIDLNAKLVEAAKVKIE
jgi:tripartite-type tricarboxylate transporter receptor subunit TctC